ncbi:hypothetical protein HPB48_013640 [Haemaphysalis longicornis]|uniref:Uncharacterized protein n=1 Tax=Haemaphysalis longicornis TaxID=44386 RepID=A0A9J6FAI9_HAELO|nr:hypothetical protein HPB48_013640 [Haemaphysalis longicornis]
MVDAGFWNVELYKYEDRVSCRRRPNQRPALITNGSPAMRGKEGRIVTSMAQRRMQPGRGTTKQEVQAKEGKWTRRGSVSVKLPRESARRGENNTTFFRTREQRKQKDKSGTAGMWDRCLTARRSPDAAQRKNDKGSWKETVSQEAVP